MKLTALSDTQWKVVVAIAAAVVAYLLTQPDVPLPPIGKVVLGVITVALAVLDPNASHQP